MRTCFLILLVSFCFSASAGIFKWVDDKGVVHYSDKEQNGSEEINLPAAVTYSPSATGAATSRKAKSKKQQGYTEMSIVQPKMNETLRVSTGDVQVRIDLKPGLVSGDSITIYLDGKVLIKGSRQTSVTLTNLDRGSHTLRATVFGKDGNAKISSKSIIFHLQREALKAEASDADNTKAFNPDYGKELPGKEHTVIDGTVDVNKNFGSEGSYQEGAKDFNKGVPAGSGTFTPGPSFTPNYNQK